MGLLDALRSLFKPAEPADPVQEARQLARLLVAEIKLYNEEAVDSFRREHTVPPKLVEEIARAYQMFMDRAQAAGEQAHPIFEEEARHVFGGDLQALGSALSDIAARRSAGASR
jgi:hypothetical protein